MTAKKQKAEKLVCRYCGSDDLAPSFVKRRDRRCRKCFSKRYGAAKAERQSKKTKAAKKASAKNAPARKTAETSTAEVKKTADN